MPITNTVAGSLALAADYTRLLLTPAHPLPRSQQAPPVTLSATYANVTSVVPAGRRRVVKHLIVQNLSGDGTAYVIGLGVALPALFHLGTGIPVAGPGTEVIDLGLVLHAGESLQAAVNASSNVRVTAVCSEDVDPAVHSVERFFMSAWNGSAGFERAFRTMMTADGRKRVVTHLLLGGVGTAQSTFDGTLSDLAIIAGVRVTDADLVAYDANFVVGGVDTFKVANSSATGDLRVAAFGYTDTGV